MSGPAPQGLRRWATSSRHCLWPALLILASLAALCGALINFEAAYCCEVSAFRYGIPRAHLCWRNGECFSLLIRERFRLTKKNWKENIVDHFINWFHIVFKRVNCTHKICRFRFVALCEGDVGSMGWIFTISASNSMFSLQTPLFHYIIGLCIPGIQWLLPVVVDDLPLLFWPPLQTPTWPCLLDLVSSGYLGFTISQLLEPLTR